MASGVRWIDRFERSLARGFGVAERVRIAVTDYRLQRGGYEAVVSVELLEAVGSHHDAPAASGRSRSSRPPRDARIQHGHDA